MVTYFTSWMHCLKSVPIWRRRQKDVQKVMYEYQRLPNALAIRLLTLHPGKFKRPIQISLEPHDLFEAVELGYEALSYAWGDGSKTMPIFSKGSVICVTENLYTALQYLRHEEEPRRLWIDAVCIDQSDLGERSIQVQLMRYVYPGACRVLAWLGDEDRSSKVAFSTIEKWAEATPGEMITEAIHEGASTYYNTLTARTNSLVDLFKRPWFHRVWTFQEICLSREAKLLCGRLEIDFAQIILACLTATRTSFGDYFDDIRDAMLIWFELHTESVSRKEFSLSYLLHRTQLRLAKEPCDKIFSLLGLASGDFVPEITPSYAASLEETYSTYTRAIIKEDKNLNIFSDIERDLPNPNLPSWVPDWSKDQLTHSLAIPGEHDILSYSINQGISQEYVAADNDDPRKILLRGAYIDTITTVLSLERLLSTIQYKYFDRLSVWRLQIGAIAELSAIAGIGSRYNASNEIAEIAVMRTLCTDIFPLSDRLSREEKSQRFGWHNSKNLRGTCFPRRLSDLESQLPEPHRTDLDSYQTKEWIARDADIISIYVLLFEEERKARRRLLHRRRASDSQLLYRHLLPKSGPEWTRTQLVHEACNAIMTQARGRTMFVTTKGYIGMGPKDAKPTDKVYTLIGGEVPFVLRRTETHDEFRLVGESYVHGIMNGELWDGLGGEGPKNRGNDELPIKDVTLV